MGGVVDGDLFVNRSMCDPVMFGVMSRLRVVFGVMCRLGVVLVLTGLGVDRDPCQYANQK